MPEIQKAQRIPPIPAWGFAWIVLIALIIGIFFWTLLSSGSQQSTSSEVVISFVTEDHSDTPDLPSVFSTTDAPPMEKNRGLSRGTVDSYRVGLVLTNLGADPELLAKADSELPTAVDFAIRSDTPHLQNVINDMRAKGRELFLMVPMEPDGYPHNDPGSNPLLTSNSAEENLRRISKHTEDAQGIIGLTPFMGQAFARDTTSNEPIASWLSKSGYALLDYSNQHQRSQFVDATKEYGGTYIDNPVILDPILTDEERKIAKFEYMETISKREGISIGVIEANPDAITALNEWINSLAKKKITLTPVSSVYLPDSENSEISPVSETNSPEAPKASVADDSPAHDKASSHEGEENAATESAETKDSIPSNSKEPSQQNQAKPTTAAKADETTAPASKKQAPPPTEKVTEQQVADSQSEENSPAESAEEDHATRTIPLAPDPSAAKPAAESESFDKPTPSGSESSKKEASVPESPLSADTSKSVKKTLPIKISQTS